MEEKKKKTPIYPNRERQVSVGIKLSDAEYEKVTSVAGKVGLATSAYIRMTILKVIGGEDV